jgi:hypothetical protein
MREISEQGKKAMEDRFKLERRGLELLQVIVAEFETDPTSVQCFDLRIVEESKRVARALRKLSII